jgi:hypothetical protein
MPPDWEYLENESFVVESLLVLLAELVKDRDHLTLLLSIRCPRHLSWFLPIEFYVATRGPEPDPILIIFDAYRRATNARTRATLVEAARDGFQKIVGNGTSDDKFLEKCRKWYLQNGRSMEISARYGKAAGYDSPLFVPKGSPIDYGGGPRVRLFPLAPDK